MSQLKRVVNKELSSFLPKYTELNKQLDDYQQILHLQMIDPDDISLSQDRATPLADNIYKQAESLLNTSDQLLLTRIHHLNDMSMQALWVLAVVLILVILLISYLLMGIYYSLINNVSAINQAAKHLGDGDFSQLLHVNAADELGDIAKNFSQMQQKIHQLIAE